MTKLGLPTKGIAAGPSPGPSCAALSSKSAQTDTQGLEERDLPRLPREGGGRHCKERLLTLVVGDHRHENCGDLHGRDTQAIDMDRIAQQINGQVGMRFSLNYSCPH